MAQKTILSFFNSNKIEPLNRNKDKNEKNSIVIESTSQLFEKKNEDLLGNLASEKINENNSQMFETCQNDYNKLSKLINLDGSLTSCMIPKRKTARKTLKSQIGKDYTFIKEKQEKNIEQDQIHIQNIEKNNDIKDYNVLQDAKNDDMNSQITNEVLTLTSSSKNILQIDNNEYNSFKKRKPRRRIESDDEYETFPSSGLSHIIDNTDINLQDESKASNNSSKKEWKTNNDKLDSNNKYNSRKRIKCHIENDITEDNTESQQIKTQSNSCQKTKKIHPFFGSNKLSKSPIKQQIKEINAVEEITDKNFVVTPETLYNPSKHNYHPISDACWEKGVKVPYLALAKTLECIENISGRLKCIEILSNFFRSVIVLTPEDLLPSIYLCLNRLAPEYEALELGIGETLLMRAVAQATGRTLDKIKADVASKGDLGFVAENSRGNQKVMFAPPKLTISSVFTKFKEIAKMTGHTVMTKKTDKIQALFVACRECEARYIIRSLQGKLRIGLAEQSLLSALAQACVLTPPGQQYPPEIINSSKNMSPEAFKKKCDAQTMLLKTTYCECPNYDLIIPVLLKENIGGVAKSCQMCPGRPLKPMLAHPTKGIEEVLRRFDNNEFTCEFKYDGERAQIHRTKYGEVKIYSRNQEDNTSKYPDVIARISKILKEDTKSFILDTEAVAWDLEQKQILPFQVLSTRKRKDAIQAEITVQVCIMAFDLLYLNGESLIKKPLNDRRTLLHNAFIEIENEFKFVSYRDGNTAEAMQEFLEESIKGNCEGLMVKALQVDASYEIAKRSHNWLKLKKDYLEGIGDTIDVVVLGGYYGKGKRTGLYGCFLLACYDEENEEFQSICKIGTGFKDEELETHAKFFKQHIIEHPKSYFRYDNSVEPDDWFEPVQVWEIKCADFSISPVHKAAIGIIDPEKGISLRFPRFIRIREDKKPEQATLASQIAEMYQNQQQIQNQKNPETKSEENDFY